MGELWSQVAGQFGRWRVERCQLIVWLDVMRELALANSSFITKGIQIDPGKMHVVLRVTNISSLDVFLISLQRLTFAFLRSLDVSRYEIWGFEKLRSNLLAVSCNFPFHHSFIHVVYSNFTTFKS